EIIKAAAQSPLGIIALLSLLLGAIALAFFRNSSERTRVIIFLVIVVVAVAAGAGSLHTAIQAQAKPPADGSLPEITCSNIKQTLGVESANISLNVWNDSDQTRKLYWLGYDGKTNLMTTLGAGGQAGFFTYQNAVWRVDDGSGRCLALYRVADTKS